MDPEKDPADVVKVTSNELAPADGREKHEEFNPAFTNRMVPPEQRVNLKWKDIDFKVKKKHILRKISGEVSSGEVMAVMGPSGSGKSSILNYLAGRITPGTKNQVVTGTFTVNGVPIKPSSFRRKIAYVPQDDVLFPTSTVREGLEFSARLRLPTDVSNEERETMIDDIISALGLTKVQDTMIGNELVRGVSGGERKRAAIGIELVSNPSCLFLDEPTSGLDSYSAWKVVKVLNAVAATGCTIMCSIHQPSSEVFQEFDSLMLLASGSVIFQGALQDIDPTFRAIGFGVPPNINPSDHIMFLAQTQPLEQLPQDCENARRYGGAAQEIVKVPGNGGGSDGVGGSFASSSIAKLAATFPGGGFGGKEGGESSEATRFSPKAPILLQASMLALREIRALVRDKQALSMKVGMSAVLSAVFALVFTGVADQSQDIYTSQSHFGGLINIALLSLMITVQPALLTFPSERVSFIRERSTGQYSTIPYMLSKLMVEIPVTFMNSLISVLICYWAMGFSGSVIVLTAASFGVGMAGISTAMVLGSLVSSEKAAVEMSPVIILPNILFLGLFVSIEQIPVYLRWIQYLVPTKYGLNIAMLDEFHPDRASTPLIRAQWEQLLTLNNVDVDETWFYILMLFLIFFVFRVLAGIILNERAKRF